SLANRALFMDRLRHSLAGMPRRSDSVAVMFLDLDRFKLVNDVLGHAAGDELLRQVGYRLKECLREGDTVARFGGDEFTILLDALAEPVVAIQVAERILQRLKEPFTVDGRETFIGASIGIAYSGLSCPDAER